MRMQTRIAAVLGSGVIAFGGLGLATAQPASAALNDAKLYHRTDSAVSSVKACKDRVSNTQCKSGGATEWLSRGEQAPWADTDGYWCPARHDCRTYYGVAYTHHENSGSSSSKFVKVSGCAGCRKGVRVM